MRSSLVVQASSPDALDPAILDQAAVLTVALSAQSHTVERSRRDACAFLLRARAERPRIRLFARINDLSTGLADADLDAILAAAPDGIVLPGCTSGADVQHLGTKLAVREAELGMADGATAIIAVAAGDAAALFRMGTYAGSSPRLVGLAWDMDRLTAAFDVQAGDASQVLPAPLQLGRMLTIVAARAAGVPAIDTACALEGEALAAACCSARRDGFVAKFATRLTQLSVIQAAFEAPDGGSAH